MDRARRRALIGAGATAAVVVVAVVAMSLAGDDGSGREAVAAGPTSTTTTTTTSTTSSTGAAPTATTEPPVEPSTTAEPPPVVCRNSRDPVCGPFSWDPVPANEPVTFTVTFEPAHPVAGQPVTMTVEAHDPEAEIVLLGSGPTASCPPSWGDGGGSAGGCNVAAFAGHEDPPRTGPWDPPAPVGASATGVFDHTYAAPGTYTVTVRAMPLTSLAVQNTDYDVYGGTDSDTVTVTVG